MQLRQGIRVIAISLGASLFALFCPLTLDASPRPASLPGDSPERRPDPAEGTTGPQPAERNDPLLDRLEGGDAEKGALAARDLLAQIASGAPEKSDHYLRYLEGALDPARAGEVGAGAAVAERLVAALGYTAASGQAVPPRSLELVLGLLGLGGDGLRRAVREAAPAFARTAGPAQGARVARELVKIIEADPPPPWRVLEDAAGVLWRVDAKELLRSAVGVLARRKEAPRETLRPYRLLLERRLGLAFPSSDEWEKWWVENRESGIETILAGAHRQFRARNAELWRKTLRRIQGTADPEACLGAIADVLDLEVTPELHAAAVDALGGFPDWLRDVRFAPERVGGPAAEEEKKGAALSRALGFLVKLLAEDRGPDRAGSPVRRKALAALRGYASHVARSPRDESAVGELIAAELRLLVGREEPAGAPANGPRHPAREDLLELVRTAGALRVRAALADLQYLIEGGTARGGEDTELAVEAIGALGRVLERGVERGPVELILRTFRARGEAAPEPAGTPAGQNGGRRDVRRACVSALNLRIDDPVLREEVQRFYRGILDAPGDRSAVVPAVIGLGILAQGGDRESAGALADLLARRESFEPPEAMAAVDAFAYLGGRGALEGLLPHLGARDQPFADHVGRKVLNLLKGQGLDLLRWTFSRLAERAFQEDRPEMLGHLPKLAQEPELAPLLLPERAAAAGPEEFASFWEASLARAEALELWGEDRSRDGLLDALGEALLKNPRAREARPRAEEELAALRGRSGRLRRARETFQAEPQAAPEGRAGALLGVLLPTEPAPARWRGLHWVLLQLHALRPSDADVRVADLVFAVLSGSPEQLPALEVWDGIPESARARSLKALDSLRGKLRSGAGPAGH